MNKNYINNLLESFNYFFHKELEVLVLISLGRSGSTFVQGLLDNNTHIINCPFLIMPNNIKIFESQKDQLSEKQIKSSKDFFVRNTNKHFSSNKLNNVIDTIVNNTTFEKNGLFMFKLFYFSIAYLNNQNLKNIKYLLVHQHIIDNNFIAERFYNNFHKVKYLFIIKNSKMQIKSTIRHIKKENYDQNYYLKSLYNYNKALKFYNNKQEEIFILKNERLNLEPKETMKKVISWLNLDFSEKYLICTNQDKIWGAFESTKKNLSGNEFSKEHIEDYKDLDKNIIIYIEYVQGMILHSFDYEFKFIKTKKDFFKHIYILFFFDIRIKEKKFSFKCYKEYLTYKFLLIFNSFKLFKKLS